MGVAPQAALASFEIGSLIGLELTKFIRLVRQQGPWACFCPTDAEFTSGYHTSGRFSLWVQRSNSDKPLTG